MNSDLTEAAETLKSGSYTCVLCKGDSLYTATGRGGKPLLLWLHDGDDLKEDFAAAFLRAASRWLAKHRSKVSKLLKMQKGERRAIRRDCK